MRPDRHRCWPYNNQPGSDSAYANKSQPADAPISTADKLATRRAGKDLT